MFAGDARTKPSGEPFSSFGEALEALLANIRLGQKSLMGTNTPAYFKNS
jgi:hypothetical protein